MAPRTLVLLLVLCYCCCRSWWPRPCAALLEDVVVEDGYYAAGGRRHFEVSDMSQAARPPRKKPISSVRELLKARKNVQGDQGDDDVDGGDFASSPRDKATVPERASKASYDNKIKEINDKLKGAPFDATGPYSGWAATDIADRVLGVECDFEKECGWHWNATPPTDQHFEVFTRAELLALDARLKAPPTDANNDTAGHFLYLAVNTSAEPVTIRSPNYVRILYENCKIEVWLHQSNMQNSSFKVIAQPTNGPPWVLGEIQGDNFEKWTVHSFSVGRIQQEFRIVLETYPGVMMHLPSYAGGHIALDNLKMSDCFHELLTVDKCSSRQLKCISNKVPACINSSRVCDILPDCDQGEDEMQDCDKMPIGSRCNFEEDWCGWYNALSSTQKLQWSWNTGSTPTTNTGPETDHTCMGRGLMEGQLFYPDNSSAMDVGPTPLPSTTCVGGYLFVNMAQFGHDNGVGFASNANLDSVVFNPPPRVHGDTNSKYYNSCQIRFYFHQYGKNSGSISLSLIELKEKENSSTFLWWSARNMGSSWIRTKVILPNVTHRYYLQFESRRGMRIYSDVAIDDFSMAPECFGINIPKQELGDYNYWDPIHSEINTKPHKDFENKTYYDLTTCGASGQYGPDQQQCNAAYRNTSTTVQVLSELKFKGVQAWRVPNEGYYTVIVHGARGGLGSSGTGSSRGASVRALLEFHRGQVLYAIVGQQGSSACIKTLSVMTESNCKSPPFANGSNSQSPPYHSKTHEIKNTVIQDGGGGGGGATFLFLLNKQKHATPIMVAGGGGGLGATRLTNITAQHGKGVLTDRKPRTGHMYGPPNSTPGAGGGWMPAVGLVTQGHEEVRGQAATEGGTGGRACTGSTGPGAGGFGGGGGGCTRGGAGGGWAGGNIISNSPYGEGGYSFVDHGMAVAGFTEIQSGVHTGSGEVIIIPAISGCGCDYRCVALDEYRSKTKCICPPGWVVTGINHTACELFDEWTLQYRYVILFFAVVVFFLIIIVTIIFIMLYNRYQVRKREAHRNKVLLDNDLRLSRIRITADDSALTTFNPNYGCDTVLAGGIDVRQLPQVARDSLRLVKALGQGAFGEVYQGLYRHRDGDTIEMPVAVKTLPEMSTGQSETDFLMEAAIMAKFNHPNIVHLIGVCFDRHPRFIVLELLAGGDLKNFLRENRPKPERSSSLGMKDLVLCALDVAKGCRYMETKRFIHRDIAARNCLLTSKGPGRVVKIADFGMARDIYRADYYRKGGKAMLPIKWMPPEAFLDGIFTSKTDVWSFGVLLWEVFSLGIMPYTGCANREVMQMVTGGGRLDIPHGCPIEIYRMMCDCWNPTPSDRPTFSQLFERLTLCIQDADLMAAPLPCFTRALPLPRDMDGQSQSAQQACGMNATQASDYLVPLLPFAANPTNSTEGPTQVSGEPSVPQGHSSSEPPDPSHPETLNGMPPSHTSSSDRLLSSSHNNNGDDRQPTYPYHNHHQHHHHHHQPEHNTPKSYRQSPLVPPEYGNVNVNANNTHNSKFQPSKSTDRLLASMESAARDDSAEDDDDVNAADDKKEWETSFIEIKPPASFARDVAVVDKTPPNTGTAVEKLISIDTPQQTPTNLQPPDNSLTRSLNPRKPPVENATSSPTKQHQDKPTMTNNYVKTNLAAGTVNFVKQRPLCLDAAQLEQNLNALKKNSGSVNLNNMNILPPYVNVLTPNKLSKSAESRKIQIDPKKAIIHDLASPPAAEEEATPVVTVAPPPKEATPPPSEKAKLKNSASSNSLINGPLTDLPYADSDNVSSSSSSNNSGINAINRLPPGAVKQNNYTEVSLQDGAKSKTNGGNGGFLNNDSEISC